MFCHFSDSLIWDRNFPIVTKAIINDLNKNKNIHYYRTFMSWHMILFSFTLSENKLLCLKIKTGILLWPVLIMIVYISLIQKTIVTAFKLKQSYYNGLF